MSSNLCSMCDFAPATRVWEEIDEPTTYPVCETCWVDLAESEAEIRDSVVCEECHHKPATEIFRRLDGVVLDLCTSCWSEIDHEPIESSPCELCCAYGPTLVRAAHPIRLSDGRRIYVCTECFETTQNRKAPTHTICEECCQKFATIVISRDDERSTMDVCEACYEASLVPVCEGCGCPTTNVVERKDEDVYVCEFCV